MTDIRSYLESKGVVIKGETADELRVVCIFCDEDANKRGRLYINKTAPFPWYCHLCARSGADGLIAKHFGDPPLTSDGTAKDKESSQLTDQWRILQTAAAYYYDALADNEQAYKYLRYECGFEFDTIEKFRLGWADGQLHEHLRGKGFAIGDIVRSGLVREFGGKLVDFLDQKICIPYIQNGSVVQIRGKEIGGKYLTPPGNKALPFGIDNVRDKETVIISEGEKDCMSLWQMGFNAFGVPGAASYKEEWNAYIDEAKRVYICFDADDAGRTGAQKTAVKVGTKARVVNLPELDPKNDVTDLVVNHGYGREDFDMMLIRSRGGILITAQEAYDEWLQVEGNPDLDGFKFGIDSIDRLIAPGVLNGQVFVLLAKSSAGKSVTTINLFHRAIMHNPDIKILFLSLEQMRNEWFERARRIHRFYDLDATNQDTVEFYRKRLMLIDKNRVTESEVNDSIEQFELELGQKPDLVAIDYLGYWARSFKGEDYERTTSAIMALKAIAKDHKIAIFVPHQVNRSAELGEEMTMDNAKSSGAVGDTGDFVAGLWSSDQKRGMDADRKSGMVTMKLLKSRHGNAGRKIEFQFAPLSLAMVPSTESLFNRAKDEHKMLLSGVTSFDDVIRRHKTGDRYIIGSR